MFEIHNEHYCVTILKQPLQNHTCCAAPLIRKVTPSGLPFHRTEDRVLKEFTKQSSAIFVRDDSPARSSKLLFLYDVPRSRDRIIVVR